MSKLKLTASDIDACMSGPEVGPVDAGMIAEQALAAIELETALAAAEAALADERRHADALALRLRDVIAGEVGHHAANSDIGLKDHAARRAAEDAEAAGVTPMSPDGGGRMDQ